MFFTQVQVERTFEVGRAPVGSVFGLIDTDAEQEQQVIRTGFLNNDAMFVRYFATLLAGIPKSLMVRRLFPSPVMRVTIGQDTCARYRCF